MKEKKERPYGTTSGMERFVYALGDLGSNFVWTFCSSFLTLYYTDSVLVSAALIGTIMLICRIFDGLSDIAAGVLVEKTRTKIGKARPWFGISIIPLAVIQLFVFNVPSSISMNAKIAWIIITYFVLTVIVYTINNIAYHSMLPRISLTSKDRNKVSSLRGIFSFIAGLLLSILTPKLLASKGGEKSQAAWTAVALIYCILCVVFEAICFFGTKEKISCFDTGSDDTEKKGKKDSHDIKKGVKALVHTKYFYITITTFIFTFIINGVFLSTAIYYTRDVFGNQGLYSLIAIISILSAVAVMAFAAKLFAKFGKRNVLLVAAAIGAFGGIVGYAGSLQRSVVLILISTVLHGISLAPYVAAIFTFASDIIDYIELKVGERYEGIITSVSSIGSKIGVGLGSAILGWGLAAGNYNGSLSTQPQSALNAESFLLFIVPTISCAVCFICMWFWDIDKKTADLRNKGIADNQ
jgi:GPH family glycoside/pentoside/hexuronide:cation symporter